MRRHAFVILNAESAKIRIHSFGLRKPVSVL
jgi:hypothetical protein